MVADRRKGGKAYSPSTTPDDVGALVARNLDAVMQSRQITGDPELARQCGLDQKTVWRVRHGAMSPTIRTVERMAVALGLHAWQLIYPGLDPEKPPHPMRRATDRK